MINESSPIQWHPYSVHHVGESLNPILLPFSTLELQSGNDQSCDGRNTPFEQYISLKSSHDS